MLTQRMPSGSIIKITVVYDEPFWRVDGLCGQSVAADVACSLRSPLVRPLQLGS